MIADHEAREVIGSSGLDSTLFVEAGAGTGKTRALVTRIVNLVADRGVPLSAVAAITFTEAAAAELRERIRVQLEARHATADDDLVRERCRDALGEADSAAISTLHGFARRILTEHPAESGLPPRVGVLDEINSAIEREERWERFVDSLHDDPVHEDLLVRAGVLGIVLEPAFEGQASLKDIALVLAGSWDRIAPTAAQEHPPLPPVDFVPFDQAVGALGEVVTECIDRSDRFCQHLTGSLLPEIEPIADLDDPLVKLRALASSGDWKKGSGGAAGAWGGDVKAAKDLVDDLNAARAEVVGSACHEVLVRLRTLIARDLLAAAAARRREGRLEFHDLLVLAVDLLARSESARRSLHERYRYLLLDEFQDTDPLQIRLAVAIASSIAAAEPGRWQDAEVDAGRLFFVGDPKQSIYRFRRADIELFLAARDRFGQSEALQRLTTNFRTVEPVISWINEIFGQLMPEEIPGSQPAYEPLGAARAASESVDHRPVVLGGLHPRGRAPEVRRVEAADVAAVVASVRNDPGRWPVGDPDAPGGFRPARLADVTILIPTRTELPALVAALAEHHVPYHLSTGNLVFGTQEVRDALATLAAVDDPSDELALVAALRSPLYGCSDRDLFDFHHAGGRWDLRREPPTDLGPDHPVVESLAHLHSLWERRWWERPSTLLHRLVIERRAALVAVGAERPEESWSRVRFLVDQARHFEEAHAGDLRAFLRWADLQRSETVTVHQPLAADPADDTVSVMTIHGSKGLEFPITVVSGLSGTPPKQLPGGTALWPSDEASPEIGLRKGICTLGHGDLVSRELSMDRHERLRLLYVACTRARDHLIVSGHHTSRAAESFGHQVWRAAQECPEHWRPFTRDPATEPSPRSPDDAPSLDDRAPSVDPAEREAWIIRRQGRLAGHVGRHVSATAVSRSILDAERGSAEGTAPTSGPGGDATDIDMEPPPEVETRRRGRAGTSIGRAVHAVLQVVDLSGPIDPAAFDDEVMRQAHAESIPEMAPTITDLVRSALGSDVVRSAATRPHHREVYVAAPIGGQVLEGYVDLLVESDEGLVVVDYKTDAVTSDAEIEATLAGYQLQGAAYAVALEIATGLPVVDCRFVFCRRSGAVERSVADLDEAKERIRRHLQEVPS